MEAKPDMPHVYEDSILSTEEMAKFPSDGEQEMLEAEERVELGGEVRLSREVFREWFAYRMREPEECLCAAEQVAPTPVTLMHRSRVSHGVPRRQ